MSLYLHLSISNPLPCSKLVPHSQARERITLSTPSDRLLLHNIIMSANAPPQRCHVLLARRKSEVVPHSLESGYLMHGIAGGYLRMSVPKSTLLCPVIALCHTCQILYPAHANIFKSLGMGWIYFTALNWSSEFHHLNWEQVQIRLMDLIHFVPGAKFLSIVWACENKEMSYGSPISLWWFTLRVKLYL